MARNYYTVCEFDVEHGQWFDVFGTYDREEAKGEVEFMNAPRGCVTIIKHADSAAAMMAARDALPVPAKYRKAVQ